MVFKGFIVQILHLSVPNLHRPGVAFRVIHLIICKFTLLSIVCRCTPKFLLPLLDAARLSSWMAVHKEPVGGCYGLSALHTRAFPDKLTWKIGERYMQNYLKLCSFLRPSCAGSSAQVRKP